MHSMDVCNVFDELSEFSYKIFVITVKQFEPTTSGRDQDATMAPARHR